MGSSFKSAMVKEMEKAVEKGRVRKDHHLFVMLCFSWLFFPVTACVDVDARREATLDRAEQMLDMGDTPKALQVLDSFLSYDPRDLVIQSRMAEIHLDEGRPAVAVSILESIPGDMDLDSRSSKLLVRSLVEAGRWRRAAAVLSRSQAKGEHFPELVDDLLDRMASGGVPHGTQLPEVWWRRLAELQIDQDRLIEAVPSLEQIDDVGTRQKLQERLFQRGLNRRGAELFRALQEVHQPPWSPWKLLARHRLLTVDGREDEAAEVERDFLRLYAEHARRFDMLLSASRRDIRAGRIDQGLVLAQEATSLRPTRPEPLVEQALALKALDRGTEAEQVLEMALSLAPDHRAAQDLLRRLDRRSDRLVTAGPTRVRLSIDSEGGS